MARTRGTAEGVVHQLLLHVVRAGVMDQSHIVKGALL